MSNSMNRVDKFLEDTYPYCFGTIADKEYWDNIMMFITDPSQDVPLSGTQLKQIVKNPSCATLVSVLNQILLSQQLQNEESKRIKK